MELDALGAWQTLSQCAHDAALSSDLDSSRLQAIRNLAIETWRLLVPPTRGALPGGAERTWRALVEPERLVAVADALQPIIDARAIPLPDVWNASDIADDGTPLGFGNMGPMEVVYRLIARHLGYAPATGWRRVQALVTDARRLTG